MPRRDQLEFFGDKEAEAAFERDIAAAQALGANVVEFDIEPFADVARLLYEGPWVAERYAATKPLIEKDPGALHPVTRAIIEGARKSTRSRPSRRPTSSQASDAGRKARGPRST